jgi:tetratricopeptide (TPR) repeat protein
MSLALADVDRAVALAPQSARAHFVRGWAILNFPLVGGAPNPAAAVPDLQKSVELDPASAEAQLALARALLEAGRPGEALAPASRATELSTGSAEPYVLRAYAQFQLGDFVGAVDDLNQALRSANDPVQQATLLVERGYLHYKLKSPSEARDDLQEALSKDPNSLLARYLPLLLHPNLPRPAPSRLQKDQAAAAGDVLWQALIGELLPAP